MGRYATLLRIFWGTAVATSVEYRVDFVSSLLLGLFWLGWAALGSSVYFRFTDDVQGWTYPELLVVVGLFFAVNGARQAVLSPNLSRMSEYVREGTLDFLLTKPVASQFMVSFRHLAVVNGLDLGLGLVLAGAGLVASGRGLSLGAVSAFVVLLGSALVLLYGLNLALMSLGLRLVSSDGIDDLVQGLVEAGRFPVQLYRGVVQLALTFVVPVALLTTVPAEALLGRGSALALLVAPAVALLVVLLASGLWRLALRSYTGASA